MRSLLTRIKRSSARTDRINLLICGARRSGTTSLEYYLQEHREIAVLSAPDLTAVGGVEKGLPFNPPFTALSTAPNAASVYRDAVRQVAGRHPYIAWRAVYSMWFPHIIFNLAEQLPDAKLIFSLRNPIETAYSVYSRRHARGESISFEQNIGLERLRAEGMPPPASIPPSHFGNILARGFYEPAMRMFFELFPREQIHVYPFDDLVHRPEETMRGVLRFLELDESYRFRRLGEVRSASKKPAPMDPETRAWLQALYAPYNRRLFDLLGWPEDLWS